MPTSFIDKIGLTRLWANTKAYVAKLMFNLTYGLENRTTSINKTNGVTTSIVETSTGAVATTTFSTVGAVRTITTNLIVNEGIWNYRRTITITTITTGVTIVESYLQIAK